MATRDILVSSDPYEVRVAILEDGRLAECLIERVNHRQLSGNIYKGQVTSIVPGMEAAFVDIGEHKNAFLYVNDIGPFGRGESEDRHAFGLDDEENGEDDPQTINETEERPRATISDLLKDGQEILVQVYKEPIGRKGCRVTTNISLPGRYLVLLPCTNRIGVSRKILDEDLRESMRLSIRELVEEPMGAIVRTAAEEAKPEQICHDYEQLRATWDSIQAAAAHSGAPALIHEDRGLIYRLVRDVISDDVTQITVDDMATCSKMENLIRLLAPSVVGRTHLHDGQVPLFEQRGVEAEIAGLLSNRVWLSCGGYIVIDRTEAFTAIDVNTGRYVGDQDLEQTVYRANLEAATEIARQIRLRDIGGIIVIDFIDMREQEHRDTLVERFRTALSRDRSRCQIFELTQLGLMQLTRRRLHSGFSKLMMQTCPMCRGSGQVLSTSTMAIRTLRLLDRLGQRGHGDICLRTHPLVAHELTEEHFEEIRSMENEYGCSMRIVPDSSVLMDKIVEDVL